MKPSAGPTPARKGRLRIKKWSPGTGFKSAEDELSPEEPLEIQVETRSISVTMRTPGHDPELAVGFLLTEGILQRADQISAIRSYPRNQHGNVINVFLPPDVSVDFARLTRHVFASSSCGLCGKSSIAAVFGQFRPIARRFNPPPRIWLTLPQSMRLAQETFHRTGGLHAAALFSSTGELRVLREDVGRHNAVDKVIGHALLQGWMPLAETVLLVSGRASFEIMQKALAAGIPAVGAISAPSSLAVEFARRSRQTLVGFLREDRFNLYAGQIR